MTEHLSDVIPYIDPSSSWAGDYELQVAPDANEVIYDANWKMQMENNVDGYHLSFTHQSLFSVLQRRTGNQSRYVTKRPREESEAQRRRGVLQRPRGDGPAHLGRLGGR